MKKEELLTKNLTELKEMAKEKDLKITGLRKDEIVDLLALDEQEAIEQKNPNNDLSPCSGILEIAMDGFGFIRSENYLTGENDVYVSHSQIRRFNLRTGDHISGVKRKKINNERFEALIHIGEVNGINPEISKKRTSFEDLTPIYPNKRIKLENKDDIVMRIMDLISPVGKGQRGMIVSPPKAGKTTLLKQIALSIIKNEPDIHLIILLIDERPEEVTDIKETVVSDNVEVVFSTFDEQPERHKKVAEMTIEHAKRYVEAGKDVVILLDSITRLARAYNLTIASSGRTLTGGLDPTSLYMPKRFFGAARNTREAGSLTILATALVETGSRMDDVIYEEFKGTGNMEIVLSRKLQERRMFPAIDILKSSTRKEDLLLTDKEYEAINIIRRSLNNLQKEDAVENLINIFATTKNNNELVDYILRNKII